MKTNAMRQLASDSIDEIGAEERALLGYVAEFELVTIVKERSDDDEHVLSIESFFARLPVEPTKVAEMLAELEDEGLVYRCECVDAYDSSQYRVDWHIADWA